MSQSLAKTAGRVEGYFALERLRSLLYVSQKNTSPGPEGLADVDAILAVSRSRNKTLEVTGVLISALSTFAQLIEGPSSAIDQLMKSIKKDSRHTNVIVVSVQDNVPRKFEGWAMAYSREEGYIDLHIKRLLKPLLPNTSAELAMQLESLMEQFSKRLRRSDG